MRKHYSKPEIMFEDFSLNTSIAGGCEKIIDNQAAGTCALETRSGHNIFLDTVAACSTYPANGDYNGLCYHVPYDSNNLFNS